MFNCGGIKSWTTYWFNKLWFTDVKLWFRILYFVVSRSSLNYAGNIQQQTFFIGDGCNFDNLFLLSSQSPWNWIQVIYENSCHCNLWSTISTPDWYVYVAFSATWISFLNRTDYLHWLHLCDNLVIWSAFKSTFLPPSSSKSFIFHVNIYSFCNTFPAVFVPLKY